MITERISKDLRPKDSETREKRTTTQTHVTSDDVLNNAQNFSLVLGGPLYQLVRRTLAKTSLKGLE